MTTLKFLPDKVWDNKLLMWIKINESQHINAWQVDMVICVTSLESWCTSFWVEELTILFMLDNVVIWGDQNKLLFATIASGYVTSYDIESKRSTQLSPRRSW